ncbi:SH3 domain-containing protein [Caenimonas terrae]|uniref:SH3 domain-containing protein n=1 Tax=Caenimonas terrae TaxID=696074 RepID=A0ABW0NH40_9BURK
MKEHRMIRAVRLPDACAALLLAALASLPGAASAQQGESAALKRAADLRDAPGDGARSLVALPAQAPVTRLGEREGPWIRVQSAAGVAGWVHMFDVGPAGFGGGAGTSASSGGNALAGGLRGLSSLLGGGSAAPPRVATSTIGIRGLEAEDLARAQPDLNAVGRMEQLRQGEAGARQFAAEASLVAATVPELPAPARTSTPPGGNQSP